MTNEDKQNALDVIADFEKDGGNWKMRQARRLRKILKTNPSEFCDAYLAVVNPPSIETAVLMRSGAITTESTFADLHRVLNGEQNGAE